MTRNKGKLRTVIVLLAAVLCMTAFSTVAYAGGGDYYDSELPPESTATEETEPAVSEPSPAVEPGTPFTEDGIALTREKLLQNVWGYDFFGDERTLDTHIKLLRKNLREYSRYITTLRGVGYRFENGN